MAHRYSETVNGLLAPLAMDKSNFLIIHKGISGIAVGIRLQSSPHINVPYSDSPVIATAR